MAEQSASTDIRWLAHRVRDTKVYDDPEAQKQVILEGKLLANIVLESLLPAFDMLLQQQANRVFGVHQASK